MITVDGDPAPGTEKPEWIASTASLIVKAQVVREGTPQSVMHYPVRPRSNYAGAFAWRDFTFDQVQVLWKDQDVPPPVTDLIVRVYDAETPDVFFRLGNEPDFKVGEQYILYLYEVDGLAYSAGPEHWRVTGGATGAFLLDGDQVKRKGDFRNEAPRSLADFLKSTFDGFFNEASVSRWRGIRAESPKGIHFAQ